MGDMKKVSSTEGQERSANTSTLLQYRASTSAAAIMAKMKVAISNRNFPSFAELVMRDSNQLHAICLDSFPPITYLNSTSHAIMDFVHRFNSKEKRLAYTFDAGPNACLITQSKNVDLVANSLARYFGDGNKPNALDELFKCETSCEKPNKLVDFEK